ncbi:MAG: porin family protein [Bradyrhizobium sp.]|nr:porin family protein [Bradyrhizobium sp.]
MRNKLLVTFAVAMIAGPHAVSAQSTSSSSAELIMQRLDAIDKRNAKLESENAALRERLRALEDGKGRAIATASRPSATPPAAAPRESNSAMAMMPKSAGVTYKAPVAVPAAYNWTGFYIGANAGGGLADTQWSDPTLSPSDLGSHKATGWLAGVQGGYNWQTGNLVLGVEGTYHFSDLRGDHQNTISAALAGLPQFGVLTDRLATNIDGTATLAGRIGFASDSIDRTLFYAKGGAAYVRESFAQTTVANVLLLGAPPQALTANIIRTGSDNRWGWLAGLGLEHGLTENWSAKIEYDYLDFGTRSVRLNGTGCISAGGPAFCQPATSNFDIRQNAQLLMFGINYRFNNSLVVAKY